MCILPWPLVRKKRSPWLFHEISLTSNLNCSSARDLCVLASMKVTRSSLLPTAMVLPSGDQHMLMFSPRRSNFIYVFFFCLLKKIKLLTRITLNETQTDISYRVCVCVFLFHWHTRIKKLKKGKRNYQNIVWQSKMFLFFLYIPYKNITEDKMLVGDKCVEIIYLIKIGRAFTL